VVNPALSLNRSANRRRTGDGDCSLIEAVGRPNDPDADFADPQSTAFFRVGNATADRRKTEVFRTRPAPSNHQPNTHSRLRWGPGAGSSPPPQSTSGLGVGCVSHRPPRGATVLMIGATICSVLPSLHVAGDRRVPYLGPRVYDGYDRPLSSLHPMGNFQSRRTTRRRARIIHSVQTELERTADSAAPASGRPRAVASPRATRLTRRSRCWMRIPLALLCQNPRCAVCTNPSLR